jgi:hypothetical protein
VASVEMLIGIDALEVKLTYFTLLRSTLWRSWLRHYTTSRKVVGLIPDGVIGIFH